MLGKLLLLPITGPFKGLLEIAQRIQEMAEKELNDPAQIKNRLSELQMDLELGRITEEAYQKEEEELLEKLERIEADKGRAPHEEGD